jgi:hypothetical protein
MRHEARQFLVVFMMYLVLDFVLFARGVTGHLSDRLIGHGDPPIYVWSLAWWPFVFRTGSNPFLTKLIWAPQGFNLTWMTSVMLLGALTAPLTSIFGAVPVYNFSMLVAVALAASSVYLLSRRLGASLGGGFLGGLVFGFSPYIENELLWAHLNLLLVFPIPLAIYLVGRRAAHAISRSWFVPLLAAVLCTQFLLALEPFAIATFVGAGALAITFLFGSREVRTKILAITPEVSVSYVLTGVLVSPYLYYFFRPGFPAHPIWPPSDFSVDLLDFLLPSNLSAIGAILAQSSVMKSSGQPAWICVPFVILALVWYRRHREEIPARILTWSTIAACLLAAGPFLTIGGRRSLPLPWLIIERIPLISGALPVRMMLIAFMTLAIITALWFSDTRTSAPERAVGLFAILVVLVPNPRAAFWVSSLSFGPQAEGDPVVSGSALERRSWHVPDFFRDGSSQRLLHPQDVVLPLPLGGSGMLWQVQSGMNFRIASGQTGVEPGEMRRWPALDALSGSPVPEPEFQLKTFLANLGITVIVVDPANPHQSYWASMLSLLKISPVKISGVTLYRIDAGSLDEFKAADAVTVERRAQIVRFANLVAAASKYLALGPHPAMFNLGDLEASGLFPLGQTFAQGPDPYSDAAVASRNGETAVALVGTREGLQPIIDKYSREARSVFFPYPRPWRPRDANSGWLDWLRQPLLAGNTTGIPLQRLVITFDRAQLARAARSPDSGSETAIPIQ